MNHFLSAYGLFLLQALTVLVVVVLAALAVAAIASRARKGSGGGADSGKAEGRIEIVRYNKRLEALGESLSQALDDPAARRVAAKEKRAREKKEAKASAKVAKAEAKLARRRLGKDGVAAGKGAEETEDVPRRVFVLDFDGDLRASAVGKLRREITAVLTGATKADEVLIRLDSGGGEVTGYGLAASQLDRIRRRKIPLTVCVDKVAASGGYMMACVADRLFAAPFAVLGSIGVVAQIPNFHRLLKENNIDVEILTAGKYKRTLTLFGENTDEGRAKLLKDIERIHAQFKEYVSEHRPALDIEQVSTGEVWSGQDALDLGLSDRIVTSDDYLVEAAEEREVLLIGYKAKKKGLLARLAGSVEESIDRFAMRWLDRLLRSRFP